MAFTITKPIAEHKAEVIAKINSLREVKSTQPITYLTITYDADQTAQNNIQGKILEIQSKIALALPMTELFWKDSSNTVHIWDTKENYLVFLQNLAILIAERNTNLYAISWTKKAEVEALTTVSDVVTYNINLGW
jgi:hypothetical protein